MNLCERVLLGMSAVLFVTTAAAAATNDDPMTRRQLSLHTLQGAPVTVAKVMYEGKFGMTQAALMPDGKRGVLDKNGKLVLEITVPGFALKHIEVDLRGVEEQTLELLIDETTGGVKFVQSVNRSTPGYVTPLSAKARRFNSTSNGPANDDFANAELIFGTGLFDFDTVYATTDGSPEPSCNFNVSSQIANDVWFCWQAPYTGLATITDGGLSLGDSRVAIYEGSQFPGADQDPIAFGDDEVDSLNLKFRTTFAAIQGQEYLIRIGNTPQDQLLVPAIGQFSIESQAVMAGSPPSNDDCANATAVNVPSSTMGSNLQASFEAGTEGCFSIPGAKDVWYSVVGTGTTMNANTCSPPSDFDPRLAVFCGGCGPDLICITEDDDGCGPSSFDSDITWCSESGVTYLIRLQGWLATDNGLYTLNVSADDTPCEPTVRCRYQGAFCNGESCSVLFEEETEGLVGTFFGDLTDCCGTGIYDSEFCDEAFEDISLTGQDLELDDDDGDIVPLEFGFDYFGDQFFNVGVSSNGYCVFGPGDLTDSTPEDIPTHQDPDGVVAPNWSDFTLSAGGTVTFETRGVPGSRRAIVQWTNVQHFGLMDSNTFQVVFHEGTNEIHFRYEHLAVFLPGFAPPHTTGIENSAGTHGYGVPTGCTVALPTGGLDTEPPCPLQDCIKYVPRWAPLCDNASALVITEEVNFSELDGGPYDLDGVSNGVLQTNGLTLDSIISVDVECATFDVQGDFIINGAIFGADTPAIPETGPKLIIKVCESMWINGSGLIRSVGTMFGGTVNIFTGGDFHTTGNSGIEAVATATYGSQGGLINITSRGAIDQGFQGFLVVKGERAGHIRLTSCDGTPQAIRVLGRLNAGGWGPNGLGGQIGIDARQGGIYIPGVDLVHALGDLADGIIELRTARRVTPVIGPFLSPDPAIQEFSLVEEPCVCQDIVE